VEEGGKNMDMDKNTDRERTQDKVSSMINFLVANRFYPMFSTKGKLFFRKFTNTLLSEEKVREIIDQLNLKSADDCRRIREIVKAFPIKTFGNTVKDRNRGHQCRRIRESYP
jgi:hypothetical protein